MLRVNNVKVPLEHRGQVEEYLLRKLDIKRNALLSYSIFRESIDARRKSDIHFVYSLDVSLKDESSYMLRNRSTDVALASTYEYRMPSRGNTLLRSRPVVVGMGPAGLFAALLLAESGYRPLVLERGQDVDTRARDVKNFWSKSELKPNSNVQFGEGGAGTFSDGKLTTMINDPLCRKVLQDLVSAGAPAEIVYSHKPHVGTDLLRNVVKQLRHKLISLGGEVRFGAQVDDFTLRNGRLVALGVNGAEVPAEVAVLAPGHSARDTYRALHNRGFVLQAKAFSIGARVEHLQSTIDEAQYGSLAGHRNLGPAEYKLSYHSGLGRSAYTFCMCPGGAVIAAASDLGRVVTNGMSLHSRRGKNANSALLVGIGPDDFGVHPLAGVELQQRLEEHAFMLGGGNYRAPCQLVADFLVSRPSQGCGGVSPSYTPGVTYTDLALVLPGFVIETMQEALMEFDRKLKGFATADALLTGVETRSSAPLRILRDAAGISNIAGVYPAGEGAGYAGGIMSAAVDGLRAAERVIKQFALPLP